MSNERDVILGAVFPSMKAEYVDKDTAMTRAVKPSKGYMQWTAKDVAMLRLV